MLVASHEGPPVCLLATNNAGAAAYQLRANVVRPQQLPRHLLKHDTLCRQAHWITHHVLAAPKQLPLAPAPGVDAPGCSADVHAGRQPSVPSTACEPAVLSLWQKSKPRVAVCRPDYNCKAPAAPDAQCSSPGGGGRELAAAPSGPIGPAALGTWHDDLVRHLWLAFCSSPRIAGIAAWLESLLRVKASAWSSMPGDPYATEQARAASAHSVRELAMPLAKGGTAAAAGSTCSWCNELGCNGAAAAARLGWAARTP